MFVTCPLCGHAYDPKKQVACQACPVNHGCELVCCPACGYQTVDPNQSGILRMAKFFSSLKRSKSSPKEAGKKSKAAPGVQFQLRHRGRRRKGEKETTELTLADVLPGYEARVVSFSRGLPAEKRAHLLAYGLVPNYWVQVVQHIPVMVIQVAHTVLALEKELAAEVQVTDMRISGSVTQEES